MNRVGLARVVWLGSCSLLAISASMAASVAAAQPLDLPPAPPPLPPDAPPAPPPAPPEEAAPPADGAPEAAEPAPIAPMLPPGAPPAALDEAPPAAPAPVVRQAADDFEPEANDRASRRGSLRLQNSMSGSTGIRHVPAAMSGLPGTFRLSAQTGFFTGSGFLCNEDWFCPSVAGEDPDAEEELDVFQAHLGLSATVHEAVEVFLGIHNQAASNTRSRPQLLQVLGDTSFGVKGFMPYAPDQLLFFGGEAELMLLNGTGGLGLDGAGTSFAFRGLMTLDASNRQKPEDRTPLRAHLKLGYKIDRSAKLIEELETTEPPNGRGDRILRVERFGLGINRTDLFEFGFVAEYVHPIARPFLGWTIDVPVNRQGYVCDIESAADRGDLCLGEESGFAIAPSRLSLGVNVTPWSGRGLGALAAFDVGTGGTSTFVDEVKPELPWSFWLGVSYAIDTAPPPPPMVIVERAAPPPPRDQSLHGLVVEKGSMTPIPDAIVRFDGLRLTGMVTDEGGAFVTAPLPPGPYTFSVSARNYKDATCTAQLAASSPPPAEAPAKPEQNPGVPESLLPPKPVATQRPAQVTCELEKLPRVGTLVTTLVDANSYAPVAGARVRITDKMGRELVLEGDASGVFRFENIPPGPVKLTIDAPGYLPNATEVVIKEHDEIQNRIPLNQRPRQPNVTLQGANLQLKRPIAFQTGAAAIAPESAAIVEELADFLRSRPELRVEVQGHTDNAGTPLTNQTLSQNRAQAVADSLVRLGIDASRVTAKGYGDSKPVAPNTTEANRARNNRVQVVVQP